MAGRDYKDFVRSVFAPLADAAQRPELLDRLTTAPVVEERKADQFSRFKTFKFDASEVVYIPNGGFVSFYNHSGVRFLAVSSSSFILKDESELADWAMGREIIDEALDESTFLCLAHYLKGYYRLADRFRAPEEAVDVIDVVDDHYSGHPFSDLISCYRPIFIYRIPPDNMMMDENIFDIASDLCCHIYSLRSALVDDELADAIKRLRALSTVPNENLYQALTASHYRHVFLELYRCLEAIFYLPWILDLKRSGGIDTRAIDLREVCRSSLQWREKELPSMEKVFALLNPNEKLDRLEDAIILFKDLKNAPDFSRVQIGRRIYAVRNGMVHHEDYDEPNKYKPDDSQWRSISLYVALVLEGIARTYQRDLTSDSPAPLQQTARSHDNSGIRDTGEALEEG